MLVCPPSLELPDPPPVGARLRPAVPSAPVE